MKLAQDHIEPNGEARISFQVLTYPGLKVYMHINNTPSPNTKSSWCFLSCVEEGEEGLISLSTLSVFFLVISSPLDHPQEFWKSSEWIILACFIALL